VVKLQAILRRRWPIPLITLILGLLAGTVSAMTAGPVQEEVSWRAEEILLANQGGSGANIAQDVLRITRGAVARRAAEILGEPAEEADRIASLMEVSSVKDSSALSIATTDRSPAVASRRTAAFVQAFLEDRQAELQAAVDAAQRAVDQASAALAEFDRANPDIASALAPPTDIEGQSRFQARQELSNAYQTALSDLANSKRTLTQSTPYISLGPQSPTRAQSTLLAVPTSTWFRAGLLGSLGFLLGIGLVMLIERAHPRLDSRDELAAAVDLPILAEIGHLADRQRSSDSEGRLLLDGVWAEPYRRVRAAIQFVQAHPGHGAVEAGSKRVFLFTSAFPGEGKSTSAALTAIALAEVGVPTLVVGGDFRKPEVDALLGVESNPGLRERARLDINRPSIDEVVHPTHHANLWVVPSGRPTREVGGMVESAREVALEASGRGATVVIDSSPLQAANDTVDLLPVVDEVILVVRSGRITAAALRDSLELIGRHGAHVMGLVLIGTPGLGRRQTYYYGYYSAVGGAEFPEGTEAGASTGHPKVSESVVSQR
jgi:Mrp family chromosome partitioning ATPase